MLLMSSSSTFFKVSYMSMRGFGGWSCCCLVRCFWLFLSFVSGGSLRALSLDPRLRPRFPPLLRVGPSPLSSMRRAFRASCMF
jgi:hypothetical protein